MAYLCVMIRWGGYASVDNHVGFGKVFGNRKKPWVLISFLNAVLQLEGKQRIVSVKHILASQKGK